MITNAELQERKEKVLAPGFINIHHVYPDRALNAELWDVEGNRYIDFGTGVAVTGTGHCHPAITAAVKEQLDRFSHTCLMVNTYESAVLLAERLTEIAPGDGAKKAAFFTTGAEAVENAVKIARAHTRRRGVIAFAGGFHGRTLLTLALTGKVAPYSTLFGPLPGDVFHAPFPIEYHGISVNSTVAAIDRLFAADIATADVAAIILEPVLGEGGFYPAPVELLQRLRAICDEHGIVLISDEIQSGFGRTGKMFGIEHAGVEPDLITFAKAVAGGFPISGVIGKAEIMDAPQPGGLGGTYAGSPLACVAALEVLDIIERQDLLGRSRQIGDLLGRRLRELQEKHPDVIGDVRADRGAMVAVELVKEGNADRPDADLTKALLGAALQKGLILLSCGMRGNVIRLIPPLTITDELVDEGMDLFGECLEELTG